MDTSLVPKYKTRAWIEYFVEAGSIWRASWPNGPSQRVKVEQVDHEAETIDLTQLEGTARRTYRLPYGKVEFIQLIQMAAG